MRYNCYQQLWSTDDSLLEMVLESHIKIKCISSIPEADADEGAATCGQTRTHVALSKTKERCTRRTDTFSPSPLSSCIRSTKYRLESLTVSTAMPGNSRTGACANSSPAGQEDEWQLQTRPTPSSHRWKEASRRCNTDVPADLTRHFVLQFDKRHFAPGCDPHPTRPVRSVQFPVSCPEWNIHTDHNVDALDYSSVYLIEDVQMLILYRFI